MASPHRITAIPSLDELVGQPGRAAALAPHIARAMAPKVAALHAELMIAALAPTPAPQAQGDDRLLGPDEVAVRIGKSRSWVEKNTADLPKRIRVGGEGLWSRREIEAWVRHRPLWGD